MKRIISILLVAVLLVSVAAVAASAYSIHDPDVQTVKEAIAEYEEINDVKVTTKRYYFLMPDGTNGFKGEGKLNDEGELEGKDEFAPSWIKGENFTGVGIYWWDTFQLDPPAWIGYAAEKSEDPAAPNVYYADVPDFVTGIIWNNGIDGGLDDTLDIYYEAAQSSDITCQWYDPGESKWYPEGITEEVGFGDMIWVVDPDLVIENELTHKLNCGGDWFYYYGGTCYGNVEGGDAEHNCLNAAHADGDHSNTPAPTYTLGDVDLDGDVTVMDATTIQRVLAKIVEELPCVEAAADVDGDGDVTVMDATTIQRLLAKIISEFPAAAK